jgi:hypothetical protein
VNLPAARRPVPNGPGATSPRSVQVTMPQASIGRPRSTPNVRSQRVAHRRGPAMTSHGGESTSSHGPPGQTVKGAPTRGEMIRVMISRAVADGGGGAAAVVGAADVNGRVRIASEPIAKGRPATRRARNPATTNPFRRATAAPRHLRAPARGLAAAKVASRPTASRVAVAAVGVVGAATTLPVPRRAAARRGARRPVAAARRKNGGGMDGGHPRPRSSVRPRASHAVVARISPPWLADMTRTTKGLNT